MFTPAYLIVASILTVLGVVLFMYGKRAPSLVAGLAGIALLGEPLFIFDAKMLTVVAVGTIVAMGLTKRFTALS